MKEKYVAPVVEIVAIDKEDIIFDSDPTATTCPPGE